MYCTSTRRIYFTVEYRIWMIAVCPISMIYSIKTTYSFLSHATAAVCKNEAYKILKNLLVAGTIIERASSKNKWRALVHFDDSHCRYYPLTELFRIFEQSVSSSASRHIVVRDAHCSYHPVFYCTEYNLDSRQKLFQLNSLW